MKHSFIIITIISTKIKLHDIFLYIFTYELDHENINNFWVIREVICQLNEWNYGENKKKSLFILFRLFLLQ